MNDVKVNDNGLIQPKRWSRRWMAVALAFPTISLIYVVSAFGEAYRDAVIAADSFDWGY